MEQKTPHRKVFKINSKVLKKAKWNLDLPLDKALALYPKMVVSLNDSQELRFIDSINGTEDVIEQIKQTKSEIKATKKLPRSRETRQKIKSLYDKLNSLQFQKDYVCVIMDSVADYDRANRGFTINGISYRRLLGTNGGIKKSTIIYVNEQLYPELKRRLDNGRNPNGKLVPAKLESYQALVCSGSIPIPEPRFIVVKDCITHFTEDIIMLNDENEGEPVMTYEKDYPIEHNDSDGYGIMLPSYSASVNEYLTGKYEPISGMNTRYAWNKGMVYTFDFIKFAEEVAHSYEIIDVWGHKRDLRDADLILTESMLKLWDSYESCEHYLENCRANGYQFSVTKTTPEELEATRDTNYQFLQSYKLTDEELNELCAPTVNEIKDVLGNDYRKSLVFLAGTGLNEQTIDSFSNNFVKALMIEPELIRDPYIRKQIRSMIKKRIEGAKKGVIRIEANYAMISGDPYALCQSICGLEITGLLKAGEVYHKYWIDKGSDEIVCFRAPMTCHNNIRKMKLNKSEEAAEWYKYIKTALIFNAFDTACDAMNGADKDGDTNMCTDNPILLKKTLNSPTIMCVQRKAEKIVPTEEDIIKANKLAFNDDIGIVTNHVTTMIEVQAGFEPNSEEYKELDYRIMCGQLYQQNTIDRAKGIVAKPMPSYWYSMRNMPEDATDLQKSIIAQYKPYFMSYIYPNLKSRYSQYLRNNERKVRRKFRGQGISSVEELRKYPCKNQDMINFLSHYDSDKKIGCNPCVVNRICWLFEKEFSSLPKQVETDFDYSILRCDVEYTKEDFKAIAILLQKYKDELKAYMQDANNFIDGTEECGSYTREDFIERFRVESRKICPNEEELCDIVLDLCYQTESYKDFAWDIAGDVIIRNLLQRKNYTLSYPKKGGTEFEYRGMGFTMIEQKVGGYLYDYSE